MLYGREAEQDRIARLIADACDHRRSHALVVRGETGIGKSALLEWAAERAKGAGARILRATGYQAESTIAFAGLNQLLWPVRDRLESLPGPQAAVLGGALGLDVPAAGGQDRFMAGLSVLTLLADLAETGPVLALVDDAQWLDTATAEALLFAARRLAAEGVVMLLAARDEAFDGGGLEELRPSRLGRDDAVRLLDARRDVSSPCRDRIIRESDGNPLALIEFGASWDGHGPGAGPGPLPLADRVTAAFRDQIARLPEPARLMMLIAAAEGRAHLPSTLGAAEALGVSLADLEEAERAGLMEVSPPSYRFRHPLIQSAAYRSAPASRRLEVHRALAETATDADCIVRHRVAAATAPDEDVAAAVEKSAERACDRTGYGTAARLYEEAAGLTPDPRDRARRLLTAAAAMLEAGEPEGAERTAASAERIIDDENGRARLARLRAAIEFERGDPRAAALMLAEHAGDADTLRTAAAYAWMAGEPDVLAWAAALLPETDTAVQGMARLVGGDYARGLPPLAGLVRGARHGDMRDRTEAAQTVLAALAVGDDTAALDLASAEAAHCRRLGLIGTLPNVLHLLARAQIAGGLHQDARATVAEAIRLARDTGFERRAERLGTALSRIAAIEGDARSVDPSDTASLGLLHLGQGRYEDAVRRLEDLVRAPGRHTADAMAPAADLVEAAVRAGLPDLARSAYERFRTWADAGGQPWALAVALRSQALLDDSGPPFDRALALHEGRPFEKARTELLYGEWLRRARRRSDARAPLRSALETFEGLQAAPWADRARAELRATGDADHARAVAPDLLDRLTPQELQVVRLAAEGSSSREIAAQLFLSPRTVEYHLYKAYPKLGISSRRELAGLRDDLEPAAAG